MPSSPHSMSSPAWAVPDLAGDAVGRGLGMRMNFSFRFMSSMKRVSGSRARSSRAAELFASMALKVVLPMVMVMALFFMVVDGSAEQAS